ncbi:pyrroloquinoline quinone biosynthesis protein PqqE, partial [Streptomyces asiaticus]
MREPCRTCSRRVADFGGCRCQAYALTGDAARTDPACALSPDHGVIRALTTGAGQPGGAGTPAPTGGYAYRKPGG